jgi:mitochondrial fission protein ELM1
LPQALAAMSSPKPSIWILWHKRLGDLDQMRSLTEALGWPCVIKRLAFQQPHNVPALAPLLFDRRNSDPLGPPWPDLLLAAEALSCWKALRLRQEARGASKVAAIGRPLGGAGFYDLVLTTAQYRLPRLPNVVELALPLGPPGGGDVEGRAMCDLAPGPGPFTTVLVGGTSPPDLLDEQSAFGLAEALLHHADRTERTLLVATGPRTGKAATAILARLITPPHRVHLWRAENANPYRLWIELAYEIVVTSDSVSMVRDALAADKPVHVYRLPQSAGPGPQLAGLLHSLAYRQPKGFASKTVALPFERGIIEAPADRSLLFERLVAEGRLAWFGDIFDDASEGQDHDDMATAVTAVKRLFS